MNLQDIRQNGCIVGDLSSLKKGEYYFLSYADGYVGFKMPGEERINRNGNIKIIGIPVFIALRRQDPGKISLTTPIELNSNSRVYNANPNSDIRKTLEEQLGSFRF